MDIVGAFDVHRKQITFDYIEMESGEVHRGKIRPAFRESLREWLDEFTERFSGKQIAIAVEATTGWRYVVEEIKRAGIEPHLAEPAETKSLQGRKKRAKTDRLDAGHLRDLMVIERLPESWIPPDHIQEIRTLMRLCAIASHRGAHDSQAAHPRPALPQWLSIARKLIRRAHHTLRELGEEAMGEPVLTSSSA
jgi:Transposase